MVLTPIALSACMYGIEYIRTLDWKLIDATLLVYAVVFVVYACYHLAKAAWKSDQARQQEISERDQKIVELSALFDSMVSAKDHQRKTEISQNTEYYRSLLKIKEEELNTKNREIESYSVIWTWSQVQSRELAVDMREYCEVFVQTHTIPAPTENKTDEEFDLSKLKAMQPLIDAVRNDYYQRFHDRVKALRDQFAFWGLKDFHLDCAMEIVTWTDQVSEIADRVMGLAIKELAKRQLRTLTLKQLCD